MRVLLLLVCVACASGARYAFLRTLKQPSRRVFGGTVARAGAWPGACALLTRARFASCSCAVLAPRWALTAAHCARPHVKYVQYDGLEQAESNLALVYKLYAHPEYHVAVADTGAGSDVVTLRHDVGLARTTSAMRLHQPYSSLPLRAPRDPVAEVTRYDVTRLLGQQVDVLGFGKTHAKAAGERLQRVRLLLMRCGRDEWVHCACALGAASGVCSGDSGGPVLYNGTQIGVTSLGPVECGGEALPPQPLYNSVFTVLAPYAGVLNATLHATPGVLRLREVAGAARAPPMPTLLGLLAASLRLWPLVT